jgi:hypothetical protein
MYGFRLFNTKNGRNSEVKWKLVLDMRDKLEDSKKVLFGRINHETNLIHHSSIRGTFTGNGFTVTNSAVNDKKLDRYIINNNEHKSNLMALL